MYGTSDTQTMAESMIFSWFTLKAEPTQGNIEPDGSRIINIYYDRNEYAITFETGSGSAVWSITDKYEAPVTQPENPTRTWYQFSGWSPAFPTTMPLSWTTLTAVWTPNTGTTYYVEHYQENIVWDGYDLIEVETLSGTTDTSVTPDRKSYEGFTSPSWETINIDPDGKATVKYYYSRNSYNLKIRDRDDVLVDADV
jgi:hypothetical protein